MADVNALFAKYLQDTNGKASSYAVIPGLAATLVSQGLTPDLSPTVIPEWAYIELKGWTEEQQWATKRTLDGQSIKGWDVERNSMRGDALQFTMRLLMARGPADPVRQAALAFWALRIYPEDYFRVLIPLLREMGASSSEKPLIPNSNIALARESVETARRLLNP